MSSASLRKLLHRLSSSLWFRPILSVMLGLATGLFAPAVDALLADDLFAGYEGLWSFLLRSSSEGAQDFLGTAAGALATIAAVAFSITMVTVQLASTQYSSRLLQRFISDRPTQRSLGLFLGSITYLLMVLLSVRSSDEPGGAFVPILSLGLGTLLTLACLVLVPVFLHGVAKSVQASTILARVAKDTQDAVAHLDVDPAIESPIVPDAPEGEGRRVGAELPGYVQFIDVDGLLEAVPPGAFVRVAVRTGDFLLPGLPLLTFWSDQPLSEGRLREIRRSVVVGRERTVQQDVLFGVRQLVDVALKALSPSLNDTTTALMAVNELGVIGLAVARKAGLGDRPRVAKGEHAIAVVPSFGLLHVLDEALAELPTMASKYPRVLARLLQVLAELSALAPDAPTRRELAAWGARIQDTLTESGLDPWSRALIAQQASFLEEAATADRPPLGTENVH